MWITRARCICGVCFVVYCCLARHFFCLLQGVPSIVHLSRGNLDTNSIGEIVVMVAIELSATAIVMAPHGKGAARQWFFGSVTKYVAHHSGEYLSA